MKDVEKMKTMMMITMTIAAWLGGRYIKLRKNTIFHIIERARQEKERERQERRVAILYRLINLIVH